ncbi:hypothetical protein T492DRAFT_883896, partial [Pavlovales sp. CCMP2436]
MGAETWMGKLSAPTTMQARNTLLGLMRKELGVITARAAAGARGAPWFQRTGRSANGPEDASAHADGAYREDNLRSHNADRGACLGRESSPSRFTVAQELVADSMASLSSLASLVYPKLGESGESAEWSISMLVRMEIVVSSYLGSSSTPVDPASAMTHLHSLLFNAATSQQRRSDGGGSSAAGAHILSRDLSQSLENAQSNTEIVLAALGHGSLGTPGGLQINRRPLAQLSALSTAFSSHAAIKASVIDAPRAHTQILDADAAFKAMRGSSTLSKAVSDDLLAANMEEFVSRGLGNATVNWLNKTAVPLCDAVGAVGLGEFMDRVYHLAFLVSLHPMLLPELGAIVELGFSEVESALSLVLNGTNPLAVVSATFSAPGLAGSTGSGMAGAAGSAAGVGRLASKSGGAKRPAATPLVPASKQLTWGPGTTMTTMVRAPVPASPNLATSMNGTVAMSDDPASDQFYVAQYACSRSSIVNYFHTTNSCESCLPVLTSVNTAQAQGRCPCAHLPGHANLKGAAHTA